MHIVADTHVHFYPSYDRETAFRHLVENLGRLATGALRLAFLTERTDCVFFRNLKPGVLGDGNSQFEIRPSGEANARLVCRHGEPVLTLFAGRQIVTAERLEILALTIDTDIADGLPAAEVVDRVRQEQGIPVLGWAPGKWFFRRGKVVAELLERFDPGQLLLGDTALRPWGWLEPVPMRAARRAGFAVLDGSDPLPFPGEERSMGRYASLLTCDFVGEMPVTSVRAALCSPATKIRSVGRRYGPLAVLRRLRRNAGVRRSVPAA